MGHSESESIEAEFEKLGNALAAMEPSTKAIAEAYLKGVLAGLELAGK